MKYSNICKAEFLSRPNRFIAQVSLSGKTETVHVKNTGRCKELLTDGATVYLWKSDNPLRKTEYDLVAVEKNGRIFNIDSNIPNDVAEEFLKTKYDFLRREVVYKNSRFDFYVEKGEEKTFIEVKGVTLENNNVALFPDAPTQRGRKHLLELIDAKKNGFDAKIMLVLQFEGAERFVPNKATDPSFAEALKQAQENGVEVMAYDCFVSPDTLTIRNKVKVCLD